MSIKTADEILKKMAECENPVTVSSLKTIAISKLKQERDALLAKQAALFAELRGLQRYQDNYSDTDGESFMERVWHGEYIEHCEVEAILDEYEASP